MENVQGVDTDVENVSLAGPLLTERWGHGGWGRGDNAELYFLQVSWKPQVTMIMIKMMMMMMMMIAVMFTIAAAATTTTAKRIIMAWKCLVHQDVLQSPTLESASGECFSNLLSAPRTLSDTNAQEAGAQSGTKHGRHSGASITCYIPCVTWCEGTAQLLSFTRLKSHLSLHISLA